MSSPYILQGNAPYQACVCLTWDLWTCSHLRRSMRPEEPIATIRTTVLKKWGLVRSIKSAVRSGPCIGVTPDHVVAQFQRDADSKVVDYLDPMNEAVYSVCGVLDPSTRNWIAFNVRPVAQRVRKAGHGACTPSYVAFSTFMHPHGRWLPKYRQHLIASRRVRQEYLLALYESFGYSRAPLLHNHGRPVPQAVPQENTVDTRCYSVARHLRHGRFQKALQLTRSHIRKGGVNALVKELERAERDGLLRSHRIHLPSAN